MRWTCSYLQSVTSFPLIFSAREYNIVSNRSVIYTTHKSVVNAKVWYCVLWNTSRIFAINVVRPQKKTFIRQDNFPCHKLVNALAEGKGDIIIYCKIDLQFVNFFVTLGCINFRWRTSAATFCRSKLLVDIFLLSWYIVTKHTFPFSTCGTCFVPLTLTSVVPLTRTCLVPLTRTWE
jgi:hypothetical protein